MNIKIRSGSNVENNLEINLSAEHSVENIKSLIVEKKYMLNMNAFCLILNNEIIMQDDKMLTFYKIDPNDKICATPLEYYLIGLTNDVVIVEVFLVQLSPDRLHLIARNYDSIGKIRSIISRVVPNVGLIYNRNKCPLDDNQVVAGISRLGIMDHQLIIRCDKIDITFDECSRIYDRYIMWDYWVKYEFFHSWIRSDFYQSDKNRLISRITQCKSILMSDCYLLSCKLDENLSWIPSSFLNSRFLFCEKMADRIYEICDDYLKFVKREIKLEEDPTHRNYFYDAIQVSILQSVNNRQHSTDNIDKSIRSIIIDAIDRLVCYVTDSCTNGRFWMRLFLDEFLFASSDNVELDEITFDCYSLLSVIKNQRQYKVRIPISVNTVMAVKEAVSMHTGVPVQQMYLVKRGSDRKPENDENIDGIYNYFIEILGSINELTDINRFNGGSFGSVSTSVDNITQRLMVLKEQRLSDQDLYRDISIQSIASEKVLNRSRLIENKGNVCITMEFMLGGSLKDHLEKFQSLSEDEVARLSYQILKQIEYLHRRYIIHRDIKSDNIVLDAKGNAKLIDFGLSKFTVGIKGNELEDRLSVYAPGTLCYMAPEILNREKYTNKIDIWSFGVVVIEMITARITGKRPYYGMTELLASQRIAESRSIKLGPRVRISEELRNFINSALKSDPNERSSAKDLIQEKFIKNYTDTRFIRN